MGKGGSKRKSKKEKKEKKKKNKEKDKEVEEKNRKATEALNKSYNDPTDSDDEKLEVEFRRSKSDEESGEGSVEEDSNDRLTRGSNSKSMPDMSSEIEGESEMDGEMTDRSQRSRRRKRRRDRSKEGESRSREESGRSGDSRGVSRDSRSQSKERAKDASREVSGEPSTVHIDPNADPEDGYSRIDSMLRGNIETDVEKAPTEDDKVRDFKELSDKGGGRSDSRNKSENLHPAGSGSRTGYSEGGSQDTKGRYRQRIRVKRRVKKGFVSKHRQTLYAQQAQQAIVQQQPQSSYEGNVACVEDEVPIETKTVGGKRRDSNNQQASRGTNLGAQDPELERKTLESNYQRTARSLENLRAHEEQPHKNEEAQQLNPNISVQDNNPKKVRRVRSTPRSERSQLSRNRRERSRTKGENSDSDLQFSGSKPSD